MELVAMDMKLRGMYIARQLSFKGVSFKIQEIPIDKEYIKVYNDAVALVGDINFLTHMKSVFSSRPRWLIQEGQLSVSGERMCTILVNRLED